MDQKVNFYVTLPSNSSMKEYPNNTQTNYTTLLKTPIVLNNKFEVALSEISYSSDFEVNLGKIRFQNPFYEYYSHKLYLIEPFIESNIIGQNEITREKLVKQINDENNLQFVISEYNRRYYIAYGWDHFIAKKTKRNLEPKEYIIEILVLDLILEIIDSENSLHSSIYKEENGYYVPNLTKWIFDKTRLESLKSKLQKDHSNVKTSYCPNSKYNVNYNREIFKQIEDEAETMNKYIPKLIVDKNIVSAEFNKYLIFNFDGLLANIFRGYDSLGFHRRYYQIPEKISFINYILIYTDIIQEQFFGDSLTPNLRTITV